MSQFATKTATIPGYTEKMTPKRRSKPPKLTLAWNMITTDRY